MSQPIAEWETNVCLMFGPGDIQLSIEENLREMVIENATSKLR
jgi:hypothetical protein